MMQVTKRFQLPPSAANRSIPKSAEIEKLANRGVSFKAVVAAREDIKYGTNKDKLLHVLSVTIIDDGTKLGKDCRAPHVFSKQERLFIKNYRTEKDGAILRLTEELVKDPKTDADIKNNAARERVIALLKKPRPVMARNPRELYANETLELPCFEISERGRIIRPGTIVGVNRFTYSITASASDKKERAQDPSTGDMTNIVVREGGSPYFSYNGVLKFDSVMDYDSLRAILPKDGYKSLNFDLLRGNDPDKIETTEDQAEELSPLEQELFPLLPVDIESMSVEKLMSVAKMTQGFWVEIVNFAYQYGENLNEEFISKYSPGPPLIVVPVPALIPNPKVVAKALSQFCAIDTDDKDKPPRFPCVRDDDSNLWAQALDSSEPLVVNMPMYGLDNVFMIMDPYGWASVAPQIVRVMRCLAFLSINSLKTLNMLENCEDNIRAFDTKPYLVPDYKSIAKMAGLRVSREFACELVFERSEAKYNNASEITIPEGKKRKRRERNVKSLYEREENPVSQLLNSPSGRKNIVWATLNEFSGDLDSCIPKKNYLFYVIPSSGLVRASRQESEESIIKRLDIEGRNIRAIDTVANEKFITENWYIGTEKDNIQVIIVNNSPTNDSGEDEDDFEEEVGVSNTQKSAKLAPDVNEAEISTS